MIFIWFLKIWPHLFSVLLFSTRFLLKNNFWYVGKSRLFSSMARKYQFFSLLFVILSQRRTGQLSWTQQHKQITSRPLELPKITLWHKQFSFASAFWLIIWKKTAHWLFHDNAKQKKCTTIQFFFIKQRRPNVMRFSFVVNDKYLIHAFTSMINQNVAIVACVCHRVEGKNISTHNTQKYERECEKNEKECNNAN